MAGYRLTPKARQGLQNILSYVAVRFGSRVAERVLSRVLGALELIAASPGVGRRREDLTLDEHIRFWSVGPTLIAYRRGSEDSVEVLFIERGEKDWERLLEDEGR